MTPEQLLTAFGFKISYSSDFWDNKAANYHYYVHKNAPKDFGRPITVDKKTTLDGIILDITNYFIWMGDWQAIVEVKKALRI